MKICAVIIAGGRSSRMGREKAMETVRGRRIIDRVIAAVARQAELTAINANGDAARFADTGLRVFPDEEPGIGSPLAGLNAALAFAGREGFNRVLTVPSDAPFLPDDLASRLSSAGGQAAIAASGGQAHYLTGLWSSHLLHDVGTALEMPQKPRMQDLAMLLRASVVGWPSEPYDPFFNINTPAELAEAERIAAEFGL